MKLLVFFIVTTIAQNNFAQISDSLQYPFHKDYYRTLPYSIYDYLDTVSNELKLEIVPIYIPGPPGGRSFFEFCIFNADSLLMRNGVFARPSELFTYLEDYYNYADTAKDFAVRPFEIDDFGQKIPNIVFSVSIERFSTLEQWRTFFNVLDQIFALYEQKRTDLAQRFFTSDFDSLPPKKKQIIINYRPLEINISFRHNIFHGPSPGIKEDLFFSPDNK